MKEEKFKSFIMTIFQIILSIFLNKSLKCFETDLFVLKDWWYYSFVDDPRCFFKYIILRKFVQHNEVCVCLYKKIKA